MMPASITVNNIKFPNQNKATVVKVPLSTDSASIIKSLVIPEYQTIILIMGAAISLDKTHIPWFTQLFNRGIIHAAEKANALVVTGGTQAGVMQLMGESMAKRDRKISLVGIAPEGLVSYPAKASADTTLIPLENNHSHFVLVEGQSWSDATQCLFDLLKTLRKVEKSVNVPKRRGGGTKDRNIIEKLPWVALLAGGGASAREELMYAVRRNMPVIVIAGSGGLADEVATAIAKKDNLPEDPYMAEIVADGKIRLQQLKSAPESIERLIIRILGIDKILIQAWQNFADYDANAKAHQKKFNRLQRWIIILGVIGTLLVIIQQTLSTALSDKTLTPGDQNPGTVSLIIKVILLVVPISITVLLAITNRFRAGKKWLLLRSGAEAIKREIYRYRVRSGQYSTDPEKKLAQRLESITAATMRTEVNGSYIKPCKDKIPPPMYGASSPDNGLELLTPDRYVAIRLEDQLNYFIGKTRKLEKQLKVLSCIAYIVSGLGTLLVAVGLQLWLPLTTTIVTAVTTWFGYRQTENSLIKYNQTTADLQSVRAWWNALSAEEQATQANVDSLVEHTEQVLQSEMDGWIQQMHNALDNLRKPEKKEMTDKETL